MTPTLESRSATANQENQAIAQGNAARAGFNTQYGNAVNQNNANINRVNSSYNNLQNFANNHKSFSSLYGNYFNKGAAGMGYNPATTQNAATNLTNAENIQAGMPQAATAAGNYSGATSGQITQDYQNMANSINPMVANADNALKNQMTMYSAANTYANNASNAYLTGRQTQTTGLNDLLTGANAAYGHGVTNMNNMGTLLQNQPNVTAQALRNIQSGRSGYITAQAARTTAAANAEKAAAYSRYTNLGSQARQNALNEADTASEKRGANGYYSFLSPSTTKGGARPISAATYAHDTGQNFVGQLQTMAASGNTQADAILRMIHGQNAQQIMHDQGISPYIWGVPNSGSLASYLGNTSGYSVPAAAAASGGSAGGGSGSSYNPFRPSMINFGVPNASYF
jgi:hypothetical protein